RRWIMKWTWAFSAPPVPTTAFLTSRAAYSPTVRPARAAVERTTPRAWPSFRVDCGFLLTNTSSTAAVSGECSSIKASSWRERSASRSGSGAPVFVFIWPLARWERRLPSARTRPQPVVPSPGSSPRIIKLGPSTLGEGPRSGGGVNPHSAEPLRRLRRHLPQGGGAGSRQFLQFFIRDVVIARDILDVVVILERVEQLHQCGGIVARDGNLVLRFPGKLDGI